jgi:hypothetical protein
MKLRSRCSTQSASNRDVNLQTMARGFGIANVDSVTIHNIFRAYEHKVGGRSATGADKVRIQRHHHHPHRLAHLSVYGAL